MDLLKLFDAYNLRARVFPALIAGLPTLALLFVLVPWNDLGLSQLTASTIGLVLLFTFADVGRRTGKHVQAKLNTGTTPEQWHRDNLDVAGAAKDRYRAFMSKQLKLAAPTIDEEQSNPAKANDFYLSAGNWLREHTRDTRKHAILFEENITYGFRRNLLGLKIISFAFDGIVAAICGAIFYFRPRYFATLPKIEEKLIVVVGCVLLHLAYMILGVTRPSVREASRTYGRQLILSCEVLMKEEGLPPKKIGKNKNGNS